MLEGCCWVIMFMWRRPTGMPRTKPTEEDIWAVIDRHDRVGSAHIRDRLSWHQEMLEDRDFYDGIFTRSPRMGVFYSQLPMGYDPADWVISMKLRHTDSSPLERIADSLSYDDQDMLLPTADDAQGVGVIRLLSYRLLHQEAEEWARDSVFGSPLRGVSGYLHWARHIIQVHHAVLHKAGIYQAVYASLFDYSTLHPSWARGIVEQWDSTTNTCWIGPHEMTLTLNELQVISGLPILGDCYEECIPHDDELFRRKPAGHQKKGEFIYPVGLHQALSHYCNLRRERGPGRGRRTNITLDAWAESFLRPVAHTTRFASLHDPFNTGYSSEGSLHEEIFELRMTTETHPVTITGISEEVSLVAFLATWLCYFVLPRQNKAFRPGTLLMASLIARGERISLAPALLAKIYYKLGKASAISGSRYQDDEIPWHYLHGWVLMHINGAFSCTEFPDYFTRKSFPSVMRLCKATTALTLLIHLF